LKSLAFVFVAIVGVLFLASCSEEGTPANPSQNIALDQIVGDTPPATSGPFVIRFEGNYWLSVADEKNGTMAIIGLNVWNYCTGQPGLDVVDIMEVWEPNDQDAVNQIIHGENLHISVWPLLPLSCSVLLNAEPIATGVVDMTGTDNDYFAWLHEDPKRVNSYGMSAHGFVEASNNQSGVVSVVSRTVWQQGSDFYKDNQMVNLTLVGGPE